MRYVTFAEPQELVLLGDPEVVKVVWENNKFVPYTKAHKKAGVNCQQRVSSNCWHMQDGVVAVLQLSLNVFIHLMDTAESVSGIPFRQQVFVINKTGKNLDTRWSVKTIRPITAAEIDIINTHPLHDLRMLSMSPQARFMAKRAMEAKIQAPKDWDNIIGSVFAEERAAESDQDILSIYSSNHTGAD